MPCKCSVPACRGNYDESTKVAVFSFPNDERLREKWLHAIPRTYFKITKNSKVCEKHFKDGEVLRNSTFYNEKTGETISAPMKRPKLKENVVPSIFPGCPSYMSSSSAIRESPSKKRQRLEQEQIDFAVKESLNKLNMYALVKFLDESDAPGIVCSHWINKFQNVCLYPNVRTNEARDKLLRRRADPGQDWSSCRIKILHYYGSFSAAYKHLRQAEETSNLESEDEILNKRPRKKTKMHLMYPGEESDEDCTQILSQKSTRNSDLIPYPVPPRDPSPTFDCTPPSPCSISLIPTTVGPSQLEKTPSSHSNRPAAFSSSQTIVNGKLVAWMADISVKVQQLQDKMDVMLQNQEKILLQHHHKVPERYEGIENLETLGNLPIGDDGSFTEFDSKLSQDSHFQHLLIKVLVSVGGKDMRCHIHNMLRRVLSDEVAELYTISGKSTLKDVIKKPFLATEFLKSIFIACQRVFKNMATEVKVNDAVADWLHQAKVRRIRRMKRHEKNMEKDAELV